MLLRTFECFCSQSRCLDQSDKGTKVFIRFLEISNKKKLILQKFQERLFSIQILQNVKIQVLIQANFSPNLAPWLNM